MIMTIIEATLMTLITVAILTIGALIAISPTNYDKEIGAK